MLEKKHIVEVSKSFDIDCKIIELYTFAQNEGEERNTNAKNGSGNNFIMFVGKMDNDFISKFFAHGTLYYHKTRLIKR